MGSLSVAGHLLLPLPSILVMTTGGRGSAAVQANGPNNGPVSVSWAACRRRVRGAAEAEAAAGAEQQPAGDAVSGRQWCHVK